MGRLEQAFARGYQLEMQAQANDAMVQEREIRKQKMWKEMIASSAKIDPTTLDEAMDLAHPNNSAAMAQLYSKAPKVAMKILEGNVRTKQMEQAINDRLAAKTDEQNIDQAESDYVAGGGFPRPPVGTNRTTVNTVVSQLGQNKRNENTVAGANARDANNPSGFVSVADQVMQAQNIPGLEPFPEDVSSAVWGKAVTDAYSRRRQETTLKDKDPEKTARRSLNIARSIAKRKFNIDWDAIDTKKDDFGKASGNKDWEGLKTSDVVSRIQGMSDSYGGQVTSGEISHEEAVTEGYSQLGDIKPSKDRGIFPGRTKASMPQQQAPQAPGAGTGKVPTGATPASLAKALVDQRVEDFVAGRVKGIARGQIIRDAGISEAEADALIDEALKAKGWSRAKK